MDMAPRPCSSTRARAWSRMSRLLSSTDTHGAETGRAMGRNQPATPQSVTHEGERDVASAPAAGRTPPAHCPAPGADRAVQMGPGPAAQLGAAADPVRDVVDRLLGGL